MYVIDSDHKNLISGTNEEHQEQTDQLSRGIE